MTVSPMAQAADPAAVERASAGCDTIIHLAAVCTSRRQDCHSAVPPSPVSRRINRDDGGEPAE